MTIRLQAIASYIPRGGIDNLLQAAAFGETEDSVLHKIGARWLPRKAEDEETSDLATKAVAILLEKTQLSPGNVGALVVVTQNGDGYHLPHTSAFVHAKLGLPTSVPVFDISLGCSGYVYGLHILRSLMQASNLDNGILVTADPYSKIINPQDKATTLLFGDAATATLLSNQGHWSLSNPRMGSDGKNAEQIMVKDGQFFMNGRQVFNFAALLIPKEIQALLQENGLNETDIDSYCLHQGSAGILDAIARRFPAVKDRFINKLYSTGNTVSSSIPLLLEEQISRAETKRVLISGFGVGLSWASMILNRKEI
ncbi:ketoacyl-ACP synthase III [Pigmentiphaga kullae]|uniref:3-oxoacyl-[acyl-carrier-protein] synthase-3 n=1 Tax=Pigmentiphaga kullae TaxID=151784 RepID=A0A4V2F410_9BURK|nr:ketoacyl-ACP synthase III [Pigmentiphaga kullae]RZS85977.1 3-oxoacyl-[acyl-carrier-protein] synthase-3 [Pigmentiphaga kullae]